MSLAGSTEGRPRSVVIVDVQKAVAVQESREAWKMA